MEYIKKLINITTFGRYYDDDVEEDNVIDTYVMVQEIPNEYAKPINDSQAIIDNLCHDKRHNDIRATCNAAQTIYNAAQATCNAAQTTCSAAQTTCNAAQTTCNADQATCSAAQTTCNAAQTTCSAAQTTCNATQATYNATQATYNADQATCSAAQTIHRQSMSKQTLSNADQATCNTAPSYQKKQTQKRKAIPKAVRLTVWNTYIGNIERYGECCICKGNIEIVNFECGHIISVANGGETTIDNLLPICSACNKSIGAENIPDFKRRYNY